MLGGALAASSLWRLLVNRASSYGCVAWQQSATDSLGAAVCSWGTLQATHRGSCCFRHGCGWAMNSGGS